MSIFGLTFNRKTTYSFCCHACFKASGATHMTQMILCPECGNKRCPKASDHRLACTSSNDSGQPGSVYPKQQPTGWVNLTDKQMQACVDASYFHTAWSSDLDVPMLVANLSQNLRELNT